MLLIETLWAFLVFDDFWPCKAKLFSPECADFLGPKVKANGKMPAVHPWKPSRNPCRCWRWVVWQRSLHRPCLQHQTHKLSWVEHHGWSKIIYQNHKSYSLTTLHHFTSISRPILSPWISLNASALCQHGRSAWLISVWKAYIENNLTPNIHSLQDFFQDVANKGVLNLPIAGKDEDVLIKTVGDFSSVK